MLTRLEHPCPAPLEQARWLQAPFPGSAVFYLEIELTVTLDCGLALAAIPSFRITVNGTCAARSSLQYTREQVFYESFRLRLPAGHHVLEVLVLDYQGCAPLSRLDRPRGFFCLAHETVENPRFTTGQAPWRCRGEHRYAFQRQNLPEYQCVNGLLTTDHREPANSVASFTPVLAEAGVDAWTFRQTNVDCRRLAPAPLAPMHCASITGYRIRHVDAAAAGTAYDSAARLELADAFAVPANSRRRILIELDDYYCADYEFTVTGGRNGEIRMAWAEGLFTKPAGGRKLDRERIDGLYFRGIGDCFWPGGGRRERFFNMDYRAGRYLELQIQTAAEPLLIVDFQLRENRYPLEWSGRLATGDPRLDKIAAMAFRTLQMCSHDTFMDCPYYEQLMYIGDGRLQLLTAYVTAGDLRLADHALLLWGEGLRPEGIFVSIYPARACQIIPGFSMLYIATVADYVRWRNRPEVTARIFPLAVQSLMALENWIRPDGLLGIPRGWGFIDWAAGWEQGVPPMRDGLSGVFNALYLYVLREFIEACERLGESALAARFERKARALAANVTRVFYRADRGIFADLPNEDVFSEHANALMLLSGCLPPAQAERVAETLFAPRLPMTRSTVYFDFYYLEAAMRMRRPEAFFERLQTWYGMTGLGLKTLLETPEPSRSDCHAWSSHVLYHLFASVAGLRPRAAGGRDFACEPQLGPLPALRGSLPTGSGQLDFELLRTDSGIAEKLEARPKAAASAGP